MNHAYIHIPFCKNICSYCNFCKVLYDQKFVNKYLSALESEIKEFYLNDKLSTIYVGGGTPSALKINELKKLFKILNLLNKKEDYEYTFECNPDDLNEELIDLLILNGINRISIGVESFDEDNLLFLKRTLDYKKLQENIKILRSKGINNINIDLIYALHFETLNILKNDLKLILKLNPEHISTYSLQIEENTILKINDTKYLDEETDYKMYKYINKVLKGKNYLHYEVSNFAKKGFHSKYNMAVWNNEEYYGFGLGASGYLSGFRYENTKSLTAYSNKKYRLNEVLLSKNDIMEYELILGLRKMSGINLTEFYNKYQINLQEAFAIESLIKSKELIYKNGYVFINPDKIYLLNEILIKLL